MSFNPDYESVAKAFIQHYYSKFDVGDGMSRAQGISSEKNNKLSEFQDSPICTTQKTLT